MVNERPPEKTENTSKRKTFWCGALVGAIAAALIGLFVVPVLGVIDMSATSDYGLLDWWGMTSLYTSLAWRAPDTTIPDTADPAEGLEHFAASCVLCHGAPDVPPAEWATVMQPAPPPLSSDDTQKMSDGELYYILARGIRMTGMPAFLHHHEEQDLWNLVAFTRHLNDLTAEERRQLEQATQAAGHAHHEEGRAEGGENQNENASDETDEQVGQSPQDGT